MRKKIKVDDLRIGMYVDKLDGNWLQHPFWRTAFNLVDDKDLQAIKNAGIQHVWIDTAKGDDVGTEQKAPAKDVIKPAPAAEAKPASSPVEEELAFARETLSKAKQATIDMFQEARMGNSIKIADAAPLVEAISESVMRNPSAMLSITRKRWCGRGASMSRSTLLMSTPEAAARTSRPGSMGGSNSRSGRSMPSMFWQWRILNSRSSTVSQ